MNPIRNISTLQESIWLTQHIYPQSTLFNVGGYAFIDGALQLPHLIKAINLVLEGADVIERGYAIFNDIPFNENQEFVPCDMDIIDFFHHKQAEAECRRWMEQDMQQPFDVTKNLLKIRFIITGESSCCWYTKVHHVLFDGYAMALFFNKVAELYTSYVKEVDAPALPGYAYADFIADEIEYKSTEQYGADKQWWLQRLDGVATGSAFQSIVHAGGKTSMRSHRVERRISRQLFNAITAFCEHHHLTAFHYFVATLFALHKRYNNADELLLGIPIFNRNKKQFRETLGAFVNVFPFTTPIYSGMTFTALLKQVGGELKDCYRHQRFPLYDLLKARDQPGNIYNVAFSYQRTSYDTSLGNTSVFINYLPAPEQQEDLFFHLLEYTAGADLTFAVDYAAELFPSHVIENLIDHFEHLLQAALDTPLAAIQDLPYLSVEEEVQLLETFNISSPGYPSGETIISQFEARVQATPDSIALVFEDCTLSYAVLNAHANQLAHYLQA
ncbi:condensation domain-containing protein, partial [[Flexibacter] sp. ATCC 35208]|uniref:condensation domain-containing protein n=1 Tax=[Flexibacter] sp. ATCC 35208 TaxID=1936242 RepID=UPI0009D03212